MRKNKFNNKNINNWGSNLFNNNYLINKNNNSNNNN